MARIDIEDLERRSGLQLESLLQTFKERKIAWKQREVKGDARYFRDTELIVEIPLDTLTKEDAIKREWIIPPKMPNLSRENGMLVVYTFYVVKQEASSKYGKLNDFLKERITIRSQSFE